MKRVEDNSYLEKEAASGGTIAVLRASLSISIQGVSLSEVIVRFRLKPEQVAGSPVARRRRIEIFAGD